MGVYTVPVTFEWNSVYSENKLFFKNNLFFEINQVFRVIFIQKLPALYIVQRVWPG